MRLDRPVRAYAPWLERIGPEFRRSVVGDNTDPAPGEDPYHLASLRNYRSLMPLAHEARKPMFDLRPADGALGSTGRLVQICYEEFRNLAVRIATAADIDQPVSTT